MVEFFLAKERNGNTFKIIKRYYFDLRLIVPLHHSNTSDICNSISFWKQSLYFDILNSVATVCLPAPVT